MRTLNSAKNLASSLTITLIMLVLGFITRKVFVDNVGVEYLGLNGLLQNILGVTTLLEGGFATSVVYNMYKPIAENDHPRILALLQLYKKVYRYIAFGIVAFALCLYPFIDHFMKDGDELEYVSIVYFIFVFNSVVGYFTAYKWSLINASQQVYKLTAVNLTYQVGLNLTKLAILYYTKNYILYLVIESLFGVALNVAIVRKANALFPYIVTKKRYKVEEKVKKNIVSNMKALFINKIGGYFMHSTDNIVISSYVGVSIVGLYSNYTLITGIVVSTVNQALSSFSESVGNLIASETPDRIYDVFKTTFFVNFLLVSVPLIILYNTLSPFISWWLGDQYHLQFITIQVILLNFYIDMMRSTALTFKTKAGIFQQDRFTPFLQGVINLVLSLLFVQRWGITGVLFASTISYLSIGFWQFPRLCYKHIFHQPLWNYFKHYLFYTAVGLCCLLLSTKVCCLISVNHQLVQAIANGLISVVITLPLYWVAFHRLSVSRNLKTHILALVEAVRC